MAPSETSGVLVLTGVDGVTISGKSIFDNDLAGIELMVGANGDQAAPVVSQALTDGFNLTIDGSLMSAPNGTYTVEFFASPTCDPSGFGEGEVFLGSAVVVTDATGDADFVANLPVTVLEGSVITATATEALSGTDTHNLRGQAQPSLRRARINPKTPTTQGFCDSRITVAGLSSCVLPGSGLQRNPTPGGLP